MPYASRTWDGKSGGRAVLNRSKSLASKAGEPELRVRRLASEDEPRDQLTDRGAVLETMSRATPHDPGILRPRVPVDDEVIVGRVLVLTDPRFEQRGGAHARKTESEVVARDLHPGFARHALAGGGIERRSARVVGHLESAPLVAGDPVHEARAVIGPHGERRFGEAGIAGRRAEEEHLLARRTHPVTDRVGKERSQPGAAGEDETISRNRTAIGQRHRRELACPWLHGPLHRELAILPAFGEEPLEHRSAGPARREIAAVFLEDGPAHTFIVDLRVAARDVGTGQLFERDPGIAQQGERRPLVLLFFTDQPQHADPMVELPAPAPLVLFPQGESANGHARVDAARAVGGADDAGLAARAGARVTGTPGIEQRDPGTATAQVQPGPAAERTGPDDDDVQRLVHGDQASERDRRARFEEYAAVYRKRASCTARRTTSRSAAGSAGPQGSSQASSGITPSAARARSRRRSRDGARALGEGTGDRRAGDAPAHVGAPDDAAKRHDADRGRSRR